MQVVAPTISSPVCQEQLIEASKLVAKSVEGCVEASQGATSDEGLLKQVGVAATGVTHALNDLLQHIKQYASGATPIGRHGEATDRILDVTENIFSSMGDAGRWSIGMRPRRHPDAVQSTFSWKIKTSASTSTPRASASTSTPHAASN